MANPKSTSGGNIIDNNVELLNINDDVNFNAPQYDPPCPPGIFTADSDSVYFSGSGSTCDPLLAHVRISHVSGNNILVFPDGVYASGGTGGGIIFAKDGLTLSGDTAIWGGVTLTNKLIDLSVNNNNVWFKSHQITNVNPQTKTFIVGSLNSDGGWNCNPGIMVSKNVNSADNIDLMLLTTGDASENGFFFLNFGTAPGEYLPNIRVASNAAAGRSAAFNLDLAGRVNDPQFTHFSVFYYDYDQYLLHGNQAPGIANSDLLNFTNGTGGALSAQTVHFAWVDKDYNWMIGRNSWTDRPQGALQIGDNSATYGIYQKGANSANWFAGRTKIGGSASIASQELEVIGGIIVSGLKGTSGNTAIFQADAAKAASAPFIFFKDSTGTEVGRINFGLDNTAIGFSALNAVTTGAGNVAVGSDALLGLTTNRQNTAVGASAGRLTNGRGNTFIGLGVGDLIDGGTIGDFNTFLGAETASLATGASIGSGNVGIGVFSLSGVHVVGDNNILIGNSHFITGAPSNSIFIVTNPDGPMQLSNVVVFGDQRHNILIGQNGATLSDSGDRLQVSGTTRISSLSGSGTRMVVANAAGVLSTQSIPVSLISGTTSPLRVIGGVLSWDFSVANVWGGIQSGTFAGGLINSAVGAISGIGFVANGIGFTINSVANAITFDSNGQINFTNINAGIRITSLTTTQKNSISASTGQLAYDNVLGKLCVFNGATWDTYNSVTSVSNADGTLTVTPTAGAVVASLNLAHANIWTGAQTYNVGAAGATVIPAVLLKNTTAAAAGVQQNSPALYLEGQGWKTTATAGSQTAAFQLLTVPVQGAANPTATFFLQSVINGGGAVTNLTIDSATSLACSGGLITVHNTNNATGGLSFNGAAPTSGDISVSQGARWYINNGGGSAGNDFTIARTAAATFITGTGNHLSLGVSFQPTSGTGIHQIFSILPTINQTGGANGITRGIFISPTLTAAADWRAIEIPTGMGPVLIGTSTNNLSALLTVASTTKGFLPPVMTTTQKNAISTPAAGLIVFDNVLNKHYGFDGSIWNAFY